MIYWQISFDKYVFSHLIRLLYNFYFIFRFRYLIIKKKTILKTNPPKFMISNVDFALKLSNYTSWKRFVSLKWILKNMFTIYCILSSTTRHCRSLPLTFTYFTNANITNKRLGSLCGLSMVDKSVELLGNPNKVKHSCFKLQCFGSGLEDILLL